MVDTEVRNRFKKVNADLRDVNSLDSQSQSDTSGTSSIHMRSENQPETVQESSTKGQRYSPTRVALGWMVHLYTASGVLVNFYTLIHAFILVPDFHLFAKLNWLAIFIDATDGTFARAVDIKNVIPNYDGALLDNIIDFITFSFLPALGIVRFQLVANVTLQYILSGAILISSAYAFCQTMAKTPEAFVGFPSYWNVVIYYLYYLEASPFASTVTIIPCAILSFIPIHFIYPTKTKKFMSVTLTGAYVWGALMLIPCLFPKYPHIKRVLYVSLLYVVYYIFMSLYLDNLRRKARK